MTPKHTGTITGLALAGLLAAAPMGGVFAQSTTTPGTTTPRTTAPGTTSPTSGAERPTAPVPGANSFTEGQARGRIQDTGFTNVTDLRKDDQGIWRGRATRGSSSTPVDVALDYQGNIFANGTIVDASAGTGQATPANNPGQDNRAAGTGTMGTGTTGTGTTGTVIPGTTGTVGGATVGTNAPDGTAGNPPSTAVGRAIDRAQGDPIRPDGTPGNPPGTAAGRAVDRALGTNTTGTNPGGTTGTTGTTAPAR